MKKMTKQNITLHHGDLPADITFGNIFHEHYFDSKRVCFSHEYLGTINENE